MSGLTRSALRAGDADADRLRTEGFRGDRIQRQLHRARSRRDKHAQDLGFSLQEIQELLGLRVRHGAACDAVERKTRQKIKVVQQRIRDLLRMKRTLERLVAACRDRRPTDDCPILEVLEDHDDVSH
ncbi:MAG: hypothetical protein DMD36_13885 [Gemmatimonadetes bacterium]|nr:MAG: hypothetical protein DMD36_13885 [Gemmatimonadota bacterium]